MFIQSIKPPKHKPEVYVHIFKKKTMKKTRGIGFENIFLINRKLILTNKTKNIFQLIILWDPNMESTYVSPLFLNLLHVLS